MALLKLFMPFTQHRDVMILKKKPLSIRREETSLELMEEREKETPQSNA